MDYEIRWKVRDRDGNEVYLTEERWEHIIDPDGHPDMEAYEDELMETIETGSRRQEPLQANKYRYRQEFDTLGFGNTELEAIVLFRSRQNTEGETVPNNFIVTAYQRGEP